MRFSSVRKRRSARTVFRPRRFWQNLRAARANRIFCTDKNHPCRKYGYAITPRQLPHPRECHFGCGQRLRYETAKRTKVFGSGTVAPGFDELGGIMDASATLHNLDASATLHNRAASVTPAHPL